MTVKSGTTRSKVFTNVHVQLINGVLVDTHAQSLCSIPLFTGEQAKELAFCLYGKNMSPCSNITV